MKSFERSIERFCYKHPHFGIPKLMTVVLIGDIIVYLLYFLDSTGTFLSFLVFSPYYILKGQIWRLVTFIFVPNTYSLISFIISLYFYFFIGRTLESQWGQAKFNLYYFSGIILSIIYGFIADALGHYVSLEMTSYYINMAMFFAFATMWPDERVLLFFFIPIKVKWLACLDAVLFIYDIVAGSTFFPLVAVINYLIYCGPALYRMIFHRRITTYRVYSAKSEKSAKSKTISYKSAARAEKKEHDKNNYHHKCCVCGRTDADYPNLEFRYCSRCVGYHCFCEDHINNHIHFTE